MRTRLLAALSALAGLVALTLAPTAAAAPPLPFGHACAPREGALSCSTAIDAARVPSFDGVPLDVDVFPPPTGNGPYPTIALLHGFGGSKGDMEAGGTASVSNASFYARQGYAVLVPTSRLRPLVRRAGLADARRRPRPAASRRRALPGAPIARAARRPPVGRRLVRAPAADRRGVVRLRVAAR